MAQFTLSITLGNDAMQTGNDVAEALNRAADDIWPNGWESMTNQHGTIFDVNGNRVGDWSVS